MTCPGDRSPSESGVGPSRGPQGGRRAWGQRHEPCHLTAASETSPTASPTPGGAALTVPVDVHGARVALAVVVRVDLGGVVHVRAVVTAVPNLVLVVVQLMGVEQELAVVLVGSKGQGPAAQPRAKCTVRDGPAVTPRRGPTFSSLTPSLSSSASQASPSPSSSQSSCPELGSSGQLSCGQRSRQVTRRPESRLREGGARALCRQPSGPCHVSVPTECAGGRALQQHRLRPETPALSPGAPCSRRERRNQDGDAGARTQRQARPRPPQSDSVTVQTLAAGGAGHSRKGDSRACASATGTRGGGRADAAWPRVLRS